MFAREVSNRKERDMFVPAAHVFTSRGASVSGMACAL